MLGRSRKAVRWLSHDCCKPLPCSPVGIPALAGSRELVLQLHQADDGVDILPTHPGHAHFIPRLIDGGLGSRHSRTRDADQKRDVLRPHSRERQDPSGLADAQKADGFSQKLVAYYSLL
jgi:hypothetical protein